MRKYVFYIFTIILSFSGFKSYSHDFESINNGETIFYKITSSKFPFTVEVSFKGDHYYSYSNEYKGSISIPLTVKNNGKTYSVTSISNYAFYYCSSLKSIKIPNSIVSIGDYAFRNCSSLLSLYIPNSVVSVGDQAFRNCSNLNSAYIGNSVKTIGELAFFECKKLESLNISNSLESIGMGAFSSCNSLKSLVIPNSVISIGEDAFQDCIGLNSVIIGDSVNSIGESAFQNCIDLDSLIIGNSVNSIGDCAFQNCGSIESINIPNSVTSIGYAAFQYCNGLNSVIVGSGVNFIGVSAFANCDGLNSITFNSSSPPIIQGNTFSNLPANAKIYVPCNALPLYKSAIWWGNLYNLQVSNQPIYNNISASICNGEIYNKNGFNESKTGTYSLNYKTKEGCDSIVNLSLKVNQESITNLNSEICQGETYTKNGFNASTSGLYTQNLKTISGCDSIINLNLVINYPKQTNLSAEICQGETFTQNGFNVSTSGLHTLYLKTIKGCDSIVNLNLVINKPVQTNIKAEICDGEIYSKNGFNYSKEGLYTIKLQNSKGCDSIVNLNLVVNKPKETTIRKEICELNSYNENGFCENKTGIYTQNLKTKKGCDSTVTLNLKVNKVLKPNNLKLNYKKDHFELSWKGNGYNYAVYSNNILKATLVDTFYIDYNVFRENKCYKVIAMNNDCESEFSEEICYEYSEIEDSTNKKLSFMIYPNPTKDNAILDIEVSTNDVKVIIYDLYGREIKAFELKNGQKRLIIDAKGFDDGIYNLKVINNNSSITRKLILR